MPQADLQGSVDHLAGGGAAGAVAFVPRQAAVPRPPAVAVHDHGDVGGHPAGRDPWRLLTAGVRRRTVEHRAPRGWALRGDGGGPGLAWPWDGHRGQAPGQGGPRSGGDDETGGGGRRWPGRGAQESGTGGVDGVELRAQQSGHGVEDDGGAGVHAVGESGLGHPCAGEPRQVGDQGGGGRTPAPVRQVVLATREAIQGLTGQEEVPLGQVGGQVGEDVRETDAVEERRVDLLPVQTQCHPGPGLVEEVTDLVEPGEQRAAAPRAPAVPVGETLPVAVSPHHRHGAVQPRDVQAPSPGGVHQSPADRVRARPGRHIVIQRVDPCSDPLGSPFRVDRVVVGKIVDGVGRRPQGPARRTHHSGHELDQSVFRGVLSLGPGPAEPVRRPQRRIVTDRLPQRSRRAAAGPRNGGASRAWRCGEHKDHNDRRATRLCR